MSKNLITQIDEAIGAHQLWKMRLRSAIECGSSNHDPFTVSQCDQCAFGKWLEGDDLSPAIKASVPYGVIHRLHREFHVLAGRVLFRALSDNAASAQECMAGEFAEKSDKLVRALNKWRREQEHLAP